MNKLDHGRVEWTRQSGCHTARVMGIRVGQVRYESVRGSYAAHRISAYTGVSVRYFDTLKEAKDFAVS